MDVKDLQRRLREFAAARDWQRYHSPKNLAMALMVEAAELLELFQWLTTAESHTLTRDAADKERVADELADVLLYLLQLADHTGIDLEAAVEHKLRKNAVKHPAKHAQASELPQPTAAPAVPPLGVFDSKVHLLIDWENVQPKDVDLQALAPNGTHVWVFHAPQQRIDVAWHAAYGDRVTHVAIARPGRNALDFHLSYYIGYITARQPNSTFIVISNDKGYDPMLEHSRDLGFLTTRREFRKVCAPALPDQDNALIAKMVDATTREQVSKPGKVTAAVKKPQPVAVSKPAPKEAPPTAVSAKTVIAKKVVSTPSAAKKTSVAVAAKVAKQPPSPKKIALPKPVPKRNTPAAKPQVALTAAQIARRVRDSLGKMATNKPAKKAALLKMIKSHAGPEGNNDATATLVLSLLQAQRQVAISEHGTAVSYPQLVSPIPKESKKLV